MKTTKIAAILNQPTWFLCRCRVYDTDYAIRTIDAMGGGEYTTVDIDNGESDRLKTPYRTAYKRTKRKRGILI